MTQCLDFVHVHVICDCALEKTRLLRKNLNTAFPEQRIAGLRPSHPRATQSRPSAGISRAKHRRPTVCIPPSDAIPAFGRHSPSNASQAYGLHTPSDAVSAFGRNSPSNAICRLRRPKDRLRPAIPEQRIAGLRHAYPERRNPGLRPEFSSAGFSAPACSASPL